MPHLSEPTVGVLVGAILGFVSAAILEFIRHCNTQNAVKKTRKAKLQRLLKMLYFEIEQICEILDIDARALPQDDDAVFEDVFDERPPASRPYWSKKLRALEPLPQLRGVYDAYQGELIELPDYLPNQLVKFHARVPTITARMREAASSDELEVWEENRVKLYTEGEALKLGLDAALKHD
jgi:hypothetical protein